MTTEIFDGITYQIVDSSSKACKQSNESNKATIEAGITFPLRPLASILCKEKEAEQRAKVEADSLMAFKRFSTQFWDAVVATLPEEMKKAAKIDGVSIRFENAFEARGEVEIYQKSRYCYSSSSPRTLRIVVGNYGNKSLICSKTQNISLLHTETEKIEKVASALKDRYNAEMAKVRRDTESKDSEARVKKVVEDNKTLFDSVGLSYYNVKEAGEGRYRAAIAVSATLDQWKKLADLLRSTQ